MVLCKNFWFVPDVAIEPTVLVVPALSCSVPLVIVKALVEPSVNASCIAHEPQMPSNVTGESIVKLEILMVFVPDVAANVITVEPV